MNLATENDFVDAWFAHPEWWFTKSNDFDALITDRYGHLLNTVDVDLSNIAKTLICDQLPRHVFRGQAANHIIEWWLQKALNYHSNIDLAYDALDSHWVFHMLPLRHTGKLAAILDVSRMAWNRIENHAIRIDSDLPLLKRFLRATYQHCPTEDQSEMIQTESDNHCEDFSDILEKEYKQNKQNKQNKQYNKTLKLDPTITCDCRTIIVSLSGGVDSMVMLSLLIDRFPEKYKQNKIVAIHINYCNRETSDREAAFVSNWCRRLGIQLYIREIREISRQPCKLFELREIYESYTKRVRFGTYKTVAKLFDTNAEPTIWLGHNMDDCFENFMTNMTARSKYADLRGMDVNSSQDGIRFVRPLLNTSKDAIYAFASRNNIPHLYDSTPKDCQRGQIRDFVVPALDRWHGRCISGLLELSSVVQQLYGVVSRLAATFGDRKQNEFVVPLNSLEESAIFWREVTIRRGAFVSNRSIETLCNNIKRFRSISRGLLISRTMMSKSLCIRLCKLNESNLCITFEQNASHLNKM